MNVLFVFGTRPEVIKLAPVIHIFNKSKYFNVKVCSTGQHREMLKYMTEFFDIKSDYELDIMVKRQSLFYLTEIILEKIKDVIERSMPDIIFVQGDTTTAFTTALAGFYSKIPVAHIEAGLRSYKKFSPYPEEINRVLISRLADLHFAPTEKARENLNKEGIKNNVYVVGNTVVDALLMSLEIIYKRDVFRREMEKKFYFLKNSSRIVLVTAHRRESFGKPLENICLAVKELAEKFEDIGFVYPVHLNPNVRYTVESILKGYKNIHLIDPLDYPSMVWLLKKSFLVMTDSGGIQEEAPTFKKPVVVLRDVTERIEGLEAGCSVLAGTDKDSIVKKVEKLLLDEDLYNSMTLATNPYGDGKASLRVLDLTKDFLL